MLQLQCYSGIHGVSSGPMGKRKDEDKQLNLLFQLLPLKEANKILYPQRSTDRGVGLESK